MTGESAASGKKKISIIGAGFSGLASAFYLVRAGYDVEIFDEKTRAGGLINTLRVPEGLVETAANAFLNSRLVEDLFSVVNVSMIGTKPSARRRFIFRAGRFRRWPLSLMGSLRLAGFLFQYFFDRRSVAPRAGESIAVWGERAVGREASQYLVNTALQGIYAGDPSKMSARLVLGRFFSSSADQAAVSSAIGSSKPRVRGSVAPLGGMGQLISGLEAYLRLQGVRFHLGESVAVESDAHPWIVATSPRSAAAFVPWRAKELMSVEMNPVATTTAFFSQTDRASEGFGVLFPPVENRKVLGVLKSNFIFDGRVTGAQFSETWIQGGALANENPTEQSDDEITETIVSERTAVFNLSEAPLRAVTTRWPSGIPHYTLELETILTELNRSENNVFLMGNYLGDLGLAKILERASRLPERLAREGNWK